ncbi:MAG: 3-phosphoshikimate 1-carboxyvinyltransferase [Gammaproteobacteria bacterium]|nr:3-phosphoshikimate 1-carboxyvinyltransferase [Gammaproteobacteria bacterium]
MSINRIFRAAPGGRASGAIRVPGDKSVSHRSIMLGAIAEGRTTVEGFLEGEDNLATLKAFRAMGVAISDPVGGRLEIQGVGLHGLKAPAAPLDMGNSGTAMRLITGLLAGQDFDATLIGDESLSKRPMERVAKPLRAMGARIETGEGGRPPVRVFGGQKLVGTRYEIPVASAQIKSALLLAGLYAQGRTTLVEPGVSRDHSERMLQAFGCPVAQDGLTVSLEPVPALKACHVVVPGDISSSAFFLVAASIAPGSELLIQNVGINPTRTGVLDILRLMGADLVLENERVLGAEPVADILVRHAKLKGIDIPEQLVPLAIDEFPVLFVAAACATGVTRLRGAEELRVKETDRIQVMADGLTALGIENRVLPDGIDIIGGPLMGGVVDSKGDHRIAMAFAVAALRASGTITIHDCLNVATSFPTFVRLAQDVGMHLNVEDQAVEDLHE